VGEEQAQRTTRVVAKSIETLFRSGAFTEEMDAPRNIRAKEFLTPKAQLIEFKQDESRVDAKRDDMRLAMDGNGASPAMGLAAPKSSDVLRDLKDQLDLKEAGDPQRVEY
jgi:hypothetical protein